MSTKEIKKKIIYYCLLSLLRDTIPHVCASSYYNSIIRYIIMLISVLRM